MIDADLFQMLTLGLLGLILLVALLIYSAVAAIRKSGGMSQAAPAESTAAAPMVTSTAQYEPAPQPIAAAAPTPAAQVAPAAAQPVATAAAPAAGAEPQDQPFERDGRWWFRRGTELLVYDEGTGQWVAAPPGGVAGTGTAAAAGTAAAPSAVLAGEQAGAGAFWKCPSCGAVNGATATTCRMCFTARP
ncbi:MAG: Ran-binding zinc finger domain-containing protein [Actinomycetota bacterium]